MNVLALLAVTAAMAAPGPADAGLAARVGGPDTTGLSAEQLAGQRFVTGFEGGSVPRWLERRIERGRLAGVVLFADNFDTVAEAKRLVDELRSIRRPAGLRQPLLVMVDQEGGMVKRLPGPPTMSAEQMGEAGAGVARRQGEKTGRMLREIGINVDLAPVLDIGFGGGEIADTHRAFGSRAALVTRAGNAFASGLRSKGIAATAKHFPGFGRARLNTDDARQTIDASAKRLRRSDERPFRAFAGRGGELVMLSLATYPALDRRLPAGLSKPIATGELRRRAGFDGVSITDSLDAAAAHAVGGTGKVARLAAKAGTDLLLYASGDSAQAGAKELSADLRRGRLGRRGQVRGLGATGAGATGVASELSVRL